MQDRYVGDIGDFGKYALLNALAGDDLRLGVHWYRNSDEEANRDGKFTNYGRLRDCNPLLHDALADILRGNRRGVAAVESSGILPSKTVFYSDSLSYRGTQGRAHRSTLRLAWNTRALEMLALAEIVFMDPDNGFAGPSADLGATNASKYVFSEELEPYLHRGQSLVVYHHQTREKGGLAATLPRKFQMLRSLGFEQAWTLIFRRVSVRIYFILPAPSHVSILTKRSREFVDTEWGLGGHFELKNLDV